MIRQSCATQHVREAQRRTQTGQLQPVIGVCAVNDHRVKALSGAAGLPTQRREVECFDSLGFAVVGPQE